MASVLEMAVQFLRLASSLVPSWEQHHVSCPSSWAFYRASCFLQGPVSVPLWQESPMSSGGTDGLPST